LLHGRSGSGIEEATRFAHRKVWRGRLATIASTATLLIVGSVGTIVMFKLFPEPDVSEFDAHRQEMEARKQEPGAMTLVEDNAAQRTDGSRKRWKIISPIAVALAAALFVSKRLRPQS
jgi:hypothetical protein